MMNFHKISYSTSLHFLQIILLSIVHLTHKYFPHFKQIFVIV